jgi:hypothetical protein
VEFVLTLIMEIVASNESTITLNEYFMFFSLKEFIHQFTL